MRLYVGTIDRQLEEALLQNMGYLRYQNKLLWLLQGGRLPGVKNFKIQGQVAFPILHSGMSYLQHRLGLMKQSCSMVAVWQLLMVKARKHALVSISIALGLHVSSLVC